MEKSKVYFTKNISSQGLINIYNAVGRKLTLWIVRERKNYL